MIDFDSLFHMSFLFLIVLDPPGNVPLFASILKHFPEGQQRQIIVREMFIALAVMVLFLFFGHGFFSLLQVDTPSLQITGGIILLIIAIRMIISRPKREVKKTLKDPLIVPLAVPAIAGPGILATITLYGGGVDSNKLTAFLAILIAWALTVPIMLLSPFLKRILGENGSVAMERLFGYIVVLISTQMALSGLEVAFS